MKKIFIIASLILGTSGCQGEKIAEYEKRIIELESQVVIHSDLEDELLEIISDYDTKFMNLEDMYVQVSTKYSELETSVYYLPDYVKDVMHYGASYSLLEVPKPINAFLLFDNGKKLGDFKVFESEEGVCEAEAFWNLYEKDSIIHGYTTNFGCNPEWISNEPLYVLVNNSLLTVRESIELNYVTISDLEKAKLDWVK